MPMTTKSRKAKGRNLQKLVCSALLTRLGESRGLQADDILSRSMGCNGTDVILSPAAQRALGKLAIECKNVEALNVVSTFWQHAPRYTTQLPLLIHKKRKTEPLVTLKLEDFLVIYDRSLHAQG
jgi:hypothetical protein